MMTSNEDQQKGYADFQEKVKRTVFLDNLSPKVNTQVIQTALGQFGGVVNVEFIPNYTIPYDIPQMALVEMENAKQAENVVAELTNYLFMMSGGPRPVRAQHAKAEMFADRPPPPDRKIQVHWLNQADPGFATAQNLKKLAKKHQAETLAMVKLQLEEEEKLAKQQSDMLKANYKKYEMIESIMQEGTAIRLARHYGIYLEKD